MNTRIIFITEQKEVFEEAQRLFSKYAPKIDLVMHFPIWPMLQSLEEERIIEHKIAHSWNHFQHPLLVEDSGFYFKHYPTYPGTLSRLALTGIGKYGLKKLCQINNEATAYTWIGFISNKNADSYFKDSIPGYILDDHAPDKIEEFDFYTIFHPEGAPKTLKQLAGHKKEEEFSPRMRALKKFILWYQSTERE